MADQKKILGELDRDLLRYPISVTQEFRRAAQSLESWLTAQELMEWGQVGVDLASQTVRSWEAATEYYRASPEVFRSFTLAQLHQWATLGAPLCEASPTLAAAYFRSSPGVVSRLNLSQLGQWCELGQELYRGTWKSSSLACKFMETTPVLLEHLSFPQLARFAAFLGKLSQKSYELAGECLALTSQLFPSLGTQWPAFIRLGDSLLTGSWREIRGYFEVVPKVLHRIAPGQRARYLTLAESQVRGGMVDITAYLHETSEALERLDHPVHAWLLSMGEDLVMRHGAAVPELLRISPYVLDRITLDQFGEWVREGTRVLEENIDGGLAYFRLESSRAVEVLESLSSSIELSRNREMVSLYCQALAGHNVELLPTQDLVAKSIGWASEARATTEGAHVFLPDVIDRYPTREENFHWLKVVATHQVAHLEFASFDFRFDRPASQFIDLRHRLASEIVVGGAEQLPDLEPKDSRESLTDMERLFDLFSDRKLALDIFTAVEDGRIDARIQYEYRGLRSPYVRVQYDTLRDRPLLEDLPARQAMVEFLVRLSLLQFGKVPVPQKYAPQAKAISRVFKRILTPLATVEDSAEATLRVYAIVQQIPNQIVNDEQWEDIELGQDEDAAEDGEDLTTEELQELLGLLGSQSATSSLEEISEAPYESPQDIDYRGDFKPELAQLLSRLQQDGQDGDQRASGDPISRETLQQSLGKSVELDVAQREMAKSSPDVVGNILREMGSPRLDSQFGEGHERHSEDEGGPLEQGDSEGILYDEWDFRANDYKPRWCMVHEKGIEEGDPQFYYDTLQSYGSLASQIRRQFELMVPEAFRKVRHLPEGEDFDLDAVIEAQVDRRTGNSPSEKLFWRRNKLGRDVAAVFLLDMSASTAEAIDDARRFSPPDNAPDDPVEYMIWLRTRRGEGKRRPFKRIIDLEKESTILLIHALETIGDIYGIYGFSGYGRNNVDVFVIKDIKEPFSDRVIRRLDKISPLHATRMGPAIRHATTKLDQVEAHTKLLFLLSDGRPQDRGYSREGVEKEYAVHDTRMALQEARYRQVIPFCLTVDKQGHDYLKTMCRDMSYEVLTDIQSLPQRLPYLYRRLTS